MECSLCHKGEARQVYVCCKECNAKRVREYRNKVKNSFKVKGQVSLAPHNPPPHPLSSSKPLFNPEKKAAFNNLKEWKGPLFKKS